MQPDPRHLRTQPMERSRTVLLLVDFVNPLDFEGAEDLAEAAVAASQATAKLRRQLAREEVRCIYANDNYGIWTSDFKELWRRCSEMAGAPKEIARVLKPRRNDLAILKPRHSAFYATPLDILLKQLQCRRLVVTGLAADNCVLFSAMDAYLRGYSVWIPSDCVAAESGEAKRQALEHMARVLKADISPSGEGGDRRGSKRHRT